MLFLSDADIEKLISMSETIDAVEIAFKEFAKGNVILPPRSTIMIQEYNGSISLMPSYITSIGAQATKIISIYPNNREKGLPTTLAWLFVNDKKTGMIKAFMDATYLTAMRTGAITGVAAKFLAPKDSKIAAVFGAGAQGRTQAWAACTVRNIEKVYVYDIVPELSKKFEKEMTKKLGVQVIASKTGKEAAKNADIILTATTSSKPVIKKEWLKDKVHISAIGAFYPEYRELDSNTIANSKLCVDDVNSILMEAGDILIPIKEGIITKDHIHAELKELVTKKKTGRTQADGITVFKSVGIAIQDSSVANLVLDKLEKN
jgi:ornithine cyclodeaminase/alanine dehydrogenase